MTTLGWKRVSVVVLICATTAIASPAQTFKVLTNFNGPDDGETPVGSVIQATDGNFYGTTAQGGAHYYGSVFRITPAGKMTTLYGFGAEPNCTDGAQPVAALVQGTDGNFYGTTYFGGAKSTICGGDLYFGYGTIFKITATGNLTTLYSFCSLSNCADGEYPSAELLQAIDGNFYGTTEWGGANGAGTIFKITAGGVLTTVYSFCSKANCADGAYPFSGLIQSADGTFYGTTEGGGVSVSYCSSSGGFACGTVFEITPSGKLTTLYTFCSVKNCPDGSSPLAGLIQDANGNFYGTTSAGGYLGSQDSICSDSGGCGTLFEIGSDRKFHTLHAFCMQHGCPDGMWPIAGLVQATDGKLYGTASAGGSSSTCEVGCGTIFRITSDGAFTVLYSLTNTDGADPRAGLLQATSGTFYGTTSGDEGIYGSGTVFSMSVGLGPLVTFVRGTADVGKTVEILGQGFVGSTGVSFNGTAATFKVKSDTYIAAIVPVGATTGPVTVATPSGTLTSNVPFRVRPQILSFNPTSGAVGTQVTITGVSLTQTIGVSFGGVPATSFTVNSDTQVTATVPAGALSGHIGITTAGGRTWSTAAFTVTQ